MIRATASLCAAVAIFGAAASLLAAPPTDEQIEQAIKSYNDARAATPPQTLEVMQKITTEALGELSIDEMSVSQISTLLTKAPILRYADGAYDKAVLRLRTFEDQPTEDGARACLLAFGDDLQAAKTSEEKAKVVHRALTHPKFGELAEAGEASGAISALARLTPEVTQLAADDITGTLEGLVKPELAEKMVRTYIDLLKAYSNAAADHPAKVAAMRERMVALANDAAEKQTEERTAKFYRGVSQYLNGAYARGELIDHKAPEVTINWSSDPNISSIGALKGQVVVLDFWATWCGPCVASFPKVRELAEHYQGYPVKIIGVTSLQGAHYDSEAEEKRIDTTGDPDKEYALMASYIKSRNLTWPVVFSTEDVFNPEYGVRGIPNVSIIDSTGKVRHNGLHPADSLVHKCEMIDALLREAGLPTPPPPAAEEEEKGVEG